MPIAMAFDFKKKSSIIYGVKGR